MFLASPTLPSDRSPTRACARLLADRKAKLDEMGVPWNVAEIRGRLYVVFDHGSAALDAVPMHGVGDLCHPLGVVIDRVAESRRSGR